MRTSAVIDTAQGLGLHDHAGWVFDRPADFQRHAGRFLVDGLTARQQVIYVAGHDTPSPTGWAELDAALVSGQARVTSVAEMYSAGEPVDPARQAAMFVRASEQAVADGWTGLRFAADVTSLVRTAPQRAAWVRYEHLVDGYIAREPISGLCGFHRPAVPEDALAEVTCPHPAVTVRSSHFRLYASARPPASLALAGEIDWDDLPVLATVLRRARPAPIGGRLLVDAAGVAFIDHHGLAELVRYAAELGVPAVVQAEAGSVASTVARIMQLPGLDVVVPR